MRETVGYLPITDFRIIRISCLHDGCGATFELHPSQVEGAMKKTSACCPLCGKPFTKPDIENGADVVTLLAKAVMAIDKIPTVGISFPITEDK